MIGMLCDRSLTKRSKTIARELLDTVRRNTTVREATTTVSEQAEVLSAQWA
jgi:hypothetical protein